MKVGNRDVVGPAPVSLKIHRGGPDKDYLFVAQAVMDYKEFEMLCPAPKPPLVTKVSGGQTLEFDDPRYKQKLNDYAQLRTDFTILKSLAATPGIIWDTVVMTEPETWKNYEAELKSWLTQSEMNELYGIVNEANSPSEEKRREAMDAFIQSQAELRVTQNGSQPDVPQGT